MGHLQMKCFSDNLVVLGIYGSSWSHLIFFFSVFFSSVAEVVSGVAGQLLSLPDVALASLT